MSSRQDLEELLKALHEENAALHELVTKLNERHQQDMYEVGQWRRYHDEVQSEIDELYNEEEETDWHPSQIKKQP